MEKSKRTIVQALICMGVLCVIWYGYYIAGKDAMKKNDLKHLVDDDFSFLFQVDSIEKEKESFVMNGWAFKLNEDSTENDLEILLYDLEREKIVYLETKHTMREDVNQYFSCKYDYSNSGFETMIKIDEKTFLDSDYEILVKDSNNKKVYKTGTFLSKGMQVFTNPKEFCELDVTGTEIEQFVNGGVLRVYRPDVGMYVYQYAGKFFWIWDRKDEYSVEDGTWMMVHLMTNQPENLPEERKPYGFDNLDFLFESKESSDWYTSNYRVAVVDIPTDYAITKVSTGHYTNDILWNSVFRPRYQVGNK